MTRARRLLAATLAASLALAAPATPQPAELDNLAVEELAFRTYLYARLGDRENALHYARLALEARPGHPGTLTALASLWESERDAQRLHATALSLLANAPDDDRALFFKASSEFMLRDHPGARATLLETRRLNFAPSDPFPYHAALADASARAGDWRTAVASRSALAASPADYDASARNRAALDDLLRAHAAHLTLDAFTAAAPSRHTQSTLRATAEAPLRVRTRAGVSVIRRHASLVRAEGIAAASVDTAEGLLTLDHAFDAGLALSASAGVSDTGDARAAAALSHTFRESRKAGVSAEYNAPAEDDAPYLAANIRQSRLLLHAEDLWTDRTGGSLTGGLRSLHTDTQGPGSPGWVLSGELFHHSRQRLPRVTPYLQTLWAANPDNPDVSAALTRLRDDTRTADVRGTFDLQKAGIRLDLPLKSTASLALDSYAGTSLLDGGLLGGASAELLWRPVKSLTLRAGSGWDKGTLFNELPSGIFRAFASASWTF